MTIRWGFSWLFTFFGHIVYIELLILKLAQYFWSICCLFDSSKC